MEKFYKNVRNENDEYYTPIYAIAPILKYIKPNSTIWCPFDADRSNYVKLFKANGHNVINTHIEMGIDFFNCEVPQCDYIISNPPYSLKTEVLEKLFSIGKKFAILIGDVGLFGNKKRFELLKNNQFEIMYFNKRVSYFKSYDDQKPSLNPPFSSVYLCSGILPKQIVFEELNKSNELKLF